MRKVTRQLAIGLISLFLFLWLMYSAGGRINRSASLPIGLYWIINKEPERNDIVMFRPADSGIFREAHRRGYISAAKTGYGLLFKRVVALPGDRVSIADHGVTVNGQLLERSAPFVEDNIGDPLPVLRFEDRLIHENEVLLISNHIRESFDGRYFGPQLRKQIVCVVRPLIVF